MDKPDLSELILMKTAWMRRLRVYIVSALIVVLVIYKYVLVLPFPILPVFLLLLCVFSYNGFFMYFESRNRELALAGSTAFATVRVILDLFFLSFLVHYTGGITSPFIYFSLFSIIGYSIVTGNVRRNVFMGIWGVVAYSSVLLLERFEFIMHYPLVTSDTAYLSLRIVLITMLIYFTAVMILVFMITYIVALLEKKEIEVLVKDAEIKKTKDFLDATFNAADDLIWVIDESGKLLDVNEKTLRLTGRVRVELIGKDISKTFVTPEVSNIILGDVARRAGGEHIAPYEFVLTSKEGVDIPVEVRASVIGGVGQVLIARDVTKRREYEKNINETNRRLQRELDEIKTLHEQILGREEELGRLKDELNKLKSS